MIEDKKLGLKVAENDEEKFWTITKEKCEEELKQFEHMIIMNNHIIKLCETKIKESLKK